MRTAYYLHYRTNNDFLFDSQLFSDSLYVLPNARGFKVISDCKLSFRSNLIGGERLRTKS